LRKEPQGDRIHVFRRILEEALKAMEVSEEEWVQSVRENREEA
jgi:hypothetical protein